MIIYYHPRYNITLGVINWLHRFDGKKFEKIFKSISKLNGIIIKTVEKPIPQTAIDAFSGDLLRRLLLSKRYILEALEIPYIPLLPFSLIEKRILEPMQWAVSGTLDASRESLTGVNTWNLSGGYHHASKSAAQGFCIYNDIGITIQYLLSEKKLSKNDKTLIIDGDAHHGNGNAYVFMDNKYVTIFDIYNDDIYPRSEYTKERINIKIPLHSHISGEEYLSKLKDGLSRINGEYKLAFVIAGTDILESDPLGKFDLSIQDCVVRDKLILERLQSLSIPAVFLGGGGYSKESAMATIQSITHHFML